MIDKTNAPSAADLLKLAVTEPGTIAAAYSQFHNYSLGNMLLAWAQCREREIPLGPMATFKRWKELGRHVTKGQKAIVLCQPVTVKKDNETDPDHPDVFTRFIYRPHWFVLAQTEGADMADAPVPGWDRDLALPALDVTMIPFNYHDGNVMGYAKDRTVAINPVNPNAAKTLFHEIAHILLGHTAEAAVASEARTPIDVRECEAEAVAMLCSAALGLGGADESRGYIQSWYGQGREISDASARRIMKTADQILRAGRPAIDEPGGVS